MSFKAQRKEYISTNVEHTLAICQGIKAIASDIWEWVIDEISPSFKGIDLITYTGELSNAIEGITADLVIDVGVKVDKVEGGDHGEWLQEFIYRGVTIHEIKLYDPEGGLLESFVDFEKIEEELDYQLRRVA